eukprot:SAG11_NODE_17655_length_512_cov_1.128329_1_plen_31_part_01
MHMDRVAHAAVWDMLSNYGRQVGVLRFAVQD